MELAVYASKKKKKNQLSTDFDLLVYSIRPRREQLETSSPRVRAHDDFPLQPVVEERFLPLIWEEKTRVGENAMEKLFRPKCSYAHTHEINNHRRCGIPTRFSITLFFSSIEEAWLLIEKNIYPKRKVRFVALRNFSPVTFNDT